MADYICPYLCFYRTSSGFCGYTGGRDACQWRKITGFNYETGQFFAEPVGSYEEAYRLTPITPMTNADRIRSMSDEELAVACEDGCPPGAPICNSVETIEGETVKEHCQRCWLSWLKSPVKEETE